jgi:hypothetical protein
MNTHTHILPPPGALARSDGELPADSGPPIAEILKQHWPLIKATFKEQYVVLTDDDLDYDEGREDELLERLEQKIGRPRDEFIELIMLAEPASC